MHTRKTVQAIILFRNFLFLHKSTICKKNFLKNFGKIQVHSLSDCNFHKHIDKNFAIKAPFWTPLGKK